ncbi:MAG: hypothetical protein H6945_16540 [Zoogloeaceae bacterium]|nr:hypothetical protein [Rhodocyclaceae bacterium]MCP5237347.1 hypothetical protein [Zoogloeaceae bacterium]
MLSILIPLATIVVASYLAFSRRLAGSAEWQATVTPLASIMGSGFLISAPLLGGLVGELAIACMAVLLLLAYGVGAVIRFNIRHFEPIEHAGSGPAQRVAFLARIVLAGAYFISVTYYLQLLSAFLLNIAGVGGRTLASTLTTLLLLSIGGVGIWRGLGRLERLETYAVSLNLGMISALLLALAIHNIGLVVDGRWQLPGLGAGLDLHDARVLLGLLIVVQGFETSRYLGDTHPAELRIRSMRTAQLVSSAIYLAFIGLATVLFHGGLGADVTAVIGMVAPVAAVLPILLTVAAIGSQFSAAVADTVGAGGLIEDLSRRRVPVRIAYLLILVVTTGITWMTHVNAIIAYASRAFALFYLLQCVVALIVAWQMPALPRRRLRLVAFSTVALSCALVFAFGLPAE